MYDLISRQAAIDVVSEACFEWRGIFGRCKNAIEALPSAQPEIIKCRNCKYYISGSDDVRYCFKHDDDILWDDDDFCSRAERRTDE